MKTHLVTLKERLEKKRYEFVALSSSLVTIDPPTVLSWEISHYKVQYQNKLHRCKDVTEVMEWLGRIKLHRNTSTCRNCNEPLKHPETLGGWCSEECRGE